jgi:U3 small nucleolar RNA-associated protein 19
MPGIVTDAGHFAKRKRISADKRPVKRARSESSEEDGQAQILLLETEIFESKKNYNNIATLIKILRTDSEYGDTVLVAAISLCRVFTRFMVTGHLVKKTASTDKDIVVIKWLKERYSEYKSTLLELLGEEGASSTALTLCMRLLKIEGQHLLNGQEYNFPTLFLTEVVQALLKPGSDENARKEFSDKYVEENDDIRFYTLEAIGSVFNPRDLNCC